MRGESGGSGPKRRHSSDPAASSITPRRDEASGAQATAQEERYGGMKPPHERDAPRYRKRGGKLP